MRALPFFAAVRCYAMILMWNIRCYGALFAMAIISPLLHTRVYYAIPYDADVDLRCYVTLFRLPALLLRHVTLPCHAH